MRRNDCLIFNAGDEFNANLSEDLKYLIPINKTSHADPTGNITLYFSPIKKIEDLVNMATQMGVQALQPVITARTVAHHIKWDRLRKIIVEASEQSGRNSVPVLYPPIKFEDLDKSDLVFADERKLNNNNESLDCKKSKLLIGPEGGFSDDEFAALELSSAKSISLGKTILRAETAAVAALVKIS